MGNDMSSFSQFTGGGFVGEITAAPSGTWQANPTFNGREYLKTGVVKAYSSTYSTLSTNLPTATSQTTSTATDTNWSNYISGGLSNYKGYKLEKGGSYYYLFLMGNYQNYSNVILFSYGTSLTSAPAGNSGSYGNYGVYDSITFNGYAIWQLIYNNSGAATQSCSIGYSNSTTQTYVTDDAAVLYGRVFAASPTLCTSVRVANLNGATANIKTSTNGTTWTDRTPSITTSASSVVRAVYSTVGSTFIYVTDNGTIYTTPDGYTLTARTTPAGTPSPGSVYGPSMCVAAGPSATLISLGGYTSAGGPYLLRTTDGVNFTLINLATANNLGGAFTANIVPQIVYDTTTSRFLMSALSNGNVYAYSSDGITWTLASTKIYATASKTEYSGMNMVAGDLIICIGGASVANPCIFSNRILGSPDYVGISSAQTFATGSGLSTYLRIA
jgi:hypothetical protein